jgi:hypothetical protein
MMHKLVCLALRHRFRVVQEFSPQCRRIKCERCGGDWGMSDAHYGLGIKAMLVEWDPDFERFFRDCGYEILEPLPAWRVEPLALPEITRAARWPGAFAMALGFIAGLSVGAAGFGLAVGLVASAAISYAIMRLLMPQVYRRAYERKCNRLRA